MTPITGIWAVDNLGNTAGDVALSLNNEECYNLIRDHGLRQGMQDILSDFDLS